MRVITRARALAAPIAAVAVAAAVSVAAPPAGASTYEGTVDITCTNADAAGSGAHTLDRDNTGSGSEALNVTVTDGLGTVIFELDYSNVLGSFAGGIGDFFYTTTPVANPITFTLTSIAGNSLPEQVDIVEVGLCDGLPPTASGPTTADAGTDIAVTGVGCPEGPVTVALFDEAGDPSPIATIEGTADAAFEFAVDLTVPSDAPGGAAVVEVTCGTAVDPASEPAVLDLDIVAAQVPTTTSTTTSTTTTTTAPPAAPPPVVAEPTFTG